MASIALNRSPHHALKVCFNCKIRKKACDKGFPSCGYCTHRALVCQYSASASLLEIGNNDFDKEAPPYREFILSLKAPVAATEADGILHDQVLNIIQSTGQFIDDVTVRYFRGIHRWIPVISRRNFQNRFISSTALAPADFSILLLSMCLIASYPSPVTAQLVNQDAMYFTTKMLFAHVQEFISSSLNLIQAGILISIYEYAHGKLDTAYSSITNCAKMALAIGLHKLKPSLDPQDTEAHLTGHEENNLWWGIVIYERAIFCEIMPADQPLITIFPSSSEPLPSEWAVLDHNDTIRVMAMTRLSVSAADVKHVGRFGLQTQAAYLLDQVLNIIKIGDIKAKLLELAKVDENLIAFLGILLEKAYKTGENYCRSIALCVRSLYILHHYTLDLPFTSLENQGPTSAVALGTISKMVVDIADYYNRQCDFFDIDPPPPTTFYIVQAAAKYIDTDSCLEGDARSKDNKALRRFLDNFRRGWTIM